MRSDLEPLPLTVKPMEAAESITADYAAVIFSIGYESRATEFAKRYRGRARLYGFAFSDHRVENFHTNLAWAREHADFVVEVPEDEYRSAVQHEVQLLATANEVLGVADTIRILVDISSMTRQRIADTFLAIHRDLDERVEVDWVYVPATYGGAEPSADAVVTNTSVRGFEGWSDPSVPAVCVVGAGFEGDLALGVIDDIEPESLWAFLPQGFSKRHDVEVTSRNKAILEAADPSHVIDYRLDQPFETLLTMDSLLRGLVPNARVVLLPLGPKIFALLCVVLAASSPSQVTVWRVSAEGSRVPRDRKAGPSMCGIRIVRADAATQGG